MLLLTWLFLSAFAVLLGAELNAELERHTTRDTTEGADLPEGQRGAAAADATA
jgi:membrane protein